MKKEKMEPRFFIGVSLQTERHTMKVRQVLHGSPAFKTGVRSGDSIISISGKHVASIEESAARLRRKNNIEIRHRGRSIVAHPRGVNIADEVEVVQLLTGKGDKVPGLGHIYLFRHCNAKCDCVAGGNGCQTWYTFEGEGPNGGVLLKKHCSSLHLDLDTLKTKWVEGTCQGGPDEYI